MHMFTALFEKRADAEAVQARLTGLGIVDLDAPGVHDRASAGFDSETYSTRQDRGLWSSPKMVFPPDEDRHLHEEHLRRGGSLLTITVDDAEAGRVLEVLESSDAVDVEDRERELKQSGFAPPASVNGRKSDTEEEVIPVIQEELLVGKRAVERGGVKVRAYTVETPVQEQVTLREEHVEVERRSVNERAPGDKDVFIERTLEATERSEEIVVGKEARVVEEVSLRKAVGEREETVRDTVRHTEVQVERFNDTEATTPKDRV